MNLYETKHDGTDEEVRITLRAWEAGDVAIGTNFYDICATAEPISVLPGDKKIFMFVRFDKVTVVGIKDDGRLECVGKPVKDPDSKYANPRIEREFRIYLLISPRAKLALNFDKKRISLRVMR